MYAQLGDIVFEGLLAFKSYGISSEEEYPEHNVINGKPILQHTGSKLDERSIVLHFHASFCNPQAEYDALYTHMVNADVLPLLNGLGVLQGNYVITSMSNTVIFTDGDGNVIEMDASLSLKEWVDPTPLATKKTAAQNSAFGLSSNDPQTTGSKAVVQAPAHSVIASLQSARTNTSAVNDNLSKAQQNAAQSAEWMKKAQTRVNNARDALKSANDTIEANVSLATRTVALVKNIATTAKAIVAITDRLSHGDLPGSLAANTLLQDSMGGVSKGASNLSIMFATKLSH